MFEVGDRVESNGVQFDVIDTYKSGPNSATAVPVVVLRDVETEARVNTTDEAACSMRLVQPAQWRVGDVYDAGIDRPFFCEVVWVGDRVMNIQPIGYPYDPYEVPSARDEYRHIFYREGVRTHYGETMVAEETQMISQGLMSASEAVFIPMLARCVLSETPTPEKIKVYVDTYLESARKREVNPARDRDVLAAARAIDPGSFVTTGRVSCSSPSGRLGRTCPECKGTRRIVLFMSTVACTACGGGG